MIGAFMSAPHSPVSTAPDDLLLPRVAIIATGGTIAGIHEAPDRPSSYRPGALGVHRILESAPCLDRIAEIIPVQLFSVDSACMQPGHWVTLAARINALLVRSDIDGVVVLHGTDTLEETAYFLHLTIDSCKPVVVTGAMRPSNAISADGPMNLRNAVVAASSAACRDLGVIVVFGDELFAARSLQKRDCVPGAFSADQYGRLGVVMEHDVFIYQRPFRAKGGFPLTTPLPRVVIVQSYAGLEAETISAACTGASGVVFAGVGNGNLSDIWCSTLAELAAHGTIVVRASRVPNSTTIRNAAVDDDAFGFITADNLSPQQARVLTMLALGQTQDLAQLQAIFERY